MRAAQSGSADALEKIARRLWPDAYRLALSIVSDAPIAEDVAQESILAGLRGLDSFDVTRPLKPWMLAIVTHRALDSVKARRRRREVELLDDPAAEPRPETGLSPPMAKALDRLDERSRAVVALRHVFGYSAREIGETIDASEVNVRTILHRALQLMRADLVHDFDVKVPDGGQDE